MHEDAPRFPDLLIVRNSVAALYAVMVDDSAAHEMRRLPLALAPGGQRLARRDLGEVDQRALN